MFGLEFQNFTSYLSAFWDFEIFDIERQMYQYDSIQKQMKRLERMYQSRVNPLDSLLNPNDIKQRFRFFPHRIIELCDLLEPYFRHPTKRNNSLSVLSQVCTVLYYYGSSNCLKIPLKFILCCMGIYKVLP